MTGVNRKIVLASRPAGAVTPDNFRLVESQLLPLAEGQVRVRNHYLSLDPYMRRRMDDARSYATPHPVGEVMIGETAGIVVESRNAAWKVGDRVTAMFGWQEYGISDGNDMQRVDDARTPLSAHLGVIGMPGITAWYGLGTICRPAPRETVAVSAASGAVGSVV
ncbi:MAG: NADP-dependent oxidoreductase, partial [Pseudorhodoplanes sp.]